MRHSDDPAVISQWADVPGDANAVASNQARERHLEGSTVWSAPNVPAPAARRTKGRNEGLPNASRVEDGRDSSGTPSIEELEANAFSK